MIAPRLVVVRPVVRALLLRNAILSSAFNRELAGLCPLGPLALPAQIADVTHGKARICSLIHHIADLHLGVSFNL
jgi:hypothetical protein